MLLSSKCNRDDDLLPHSRRGSLGVTEGILSKTNTLLALMKMTRQLKVNFFYCEYTFKCSVSVLEYFKALSLRSLNNRR